MKRRWILVAGLVAVAGCGAKDNPMKAAFDHTQTGVQAVSAASTIQCTTERRIMDTAIETYITLIGSTPTSEDDLVAQGVIREASASYNLDSSGLVVADPTGPCA